MRIRKLAKELGTDDVSVMELLWRLGHGRYTDAEQQLPGPVEAQVRRHARELPQLGRNVIPAPRPEGVPVLAGDVDANDAALLARALGGVRPLGPEPKLARPKPAAPVAAARAAGPPKAAVVAAGPAAPVGGASARGPAGRAPPFELQLAEARAEAERLAATLAAAEARATAAEARAAALAAEARAGEAERAALEAALAAAREPVAASTIRAAFERRGLLSEDEMGAALRALLDAHRVGELVRLGLSRPDALDALLWERVLLLGPDEPAPPGVVAVRVPPERSEGRAASPNRAALSRFATACLVHNVKRVLVVGGSPAYHRVLKDGMDPRIDLQVLPGDKRGRVPQPHVDLVILWASTILDHSVSAQFPAGVVVPHRGVARMLTAAAEWIEARSV